MDSDEIERRFNNYEHRLTAVEGIVSEQERAVKELKEDRTSLSTSVKELVVSVQDLANRVNEIHRFLIGDLGGSLGLIHRVKVVEDDLESRRNDKRKVFETALAVIVTFLTTGLLTGFLMWIKSAG